ncbi:TetR/AcrR family transcriptional regulator [Xanthomonas theicola]|uniref:TetR family transcriptional regulator n=1 Tax=Xanthomonas theicola TaxID=56464 RepID=A0A2S6ZLA7_9XANT|nr:TetR/AcrR family transcriptional regulator [Xanthomonas theicola]PPT92986.1 TetR family transcriptional regulator [Xanthomonas theicola]QNH23801.1 TetR/AcrR family transcriptional regulator [Xanthomonas theicola]
MSEVEAPDLRARVLDAATRLIARGGIAALTTRAVAAAASVQAPTLYRLFGDKQGLLNAVAEHGLAAFLADKAALPPHPDPVQNLANAWDSYVAFGLAHPTVFAIMNEVGAPTSGSPAMLAGIAILHERVERIARAGRLRVPVERAVAMIHAAGVGTVATLLAVPEEARDMHLSPMMRDAILASILIGSSQQDHTDLASLAIGLRAHDTAKLLTPGEGLLLAELLDRLARSDEG